MEDSSSGLPADLLRQVSRSFYLTLRVLPAAIRQQMGLAYLLARTADTIADTQVVPAAQRLQALQALRERILGHSSAPLHLNELARLITPRTKMIAIKTGNAFARCWPSSPADRSWT